MRKLLLFAFLHSMLFTNFLGQCPINLQAQVTSTGRVTEPVTEPVKIDATNVTVADDNTTGIPGATGQVFSTVQTISRPAGAFGPYGVAAGKSSYMESLSGGSFSASEKTTYAPYHATLVGRAAGQNTAYNTSLAGYGLGDAFGGGGNVACWGGGYVAGTSQPLCGVAEWNVGEGNTTFTALINGTPGASATSIPYDTEANESVLGQRFLLNLTRATVAGTVASISGTTVTTTSGPNWVGGAAVCNITGAATNCDPTGQYFKVNSSDVTINSVSIGHWYKITAVINTTSFTIENYYDTANLATTGAYTVVQGSEIQSFNTTAKTLTIAANGFTWSNNDSLQSPPNHQVNLRGFNLLFNHLFKTRGATTRDVPFVITANGYPMDYGMFWDGAGGYTVMMEFQATTMGTGFEFGTGLSGEVVYLNSTTAAYLRRAGGGGGTIGLRGDNTINWATGASDTVLAMDATSKNLTVSIAGATARPVLPLTGSATLNFSNQAAVGCEVLTITVTGALDGDPVELGVPNASNTTNSVFWAWVSATNTVSVKHCAVISGDPASGTFKATVSRF